MKKSSRASLHLVDNYDDEAYSGSEDYEDIVQEDNDNDKLAAQQEANPSKGHFANLIYEIDPSDLGRIGTELLQAINDDDASRDMWKQNLKEGISALGWQLEDMSSKFKGACGVYSTAYLEGFLNLRSIITNELLRREGPCETEILGEPSEEIEDRAMRVKDWMNYSLTHKYTDYYTEKIKCWSWAIISGSGWSKTYIDPVSGKIRSPHIDPNNVIVNANAVSLKTAKRITHKFGITPQELKLKQLNGFYKQISMFNSNEDGSEDDVIDEQKRRIEGIDPEENNSGIDKGDYILYESHCQLLPYNYTSPVLCEGVDAKHLPIPFVVTLTRDGKVIRVCRGFDEDDTTYQALNPFTLYTFLEGLWFQGLGISHIALNAAKAATALLRQTIDCNTFATFPGGFIHKDLRLEKRDYCMTPGEFKPIEVPGDNINNYIMTLPFKEPSMLSKELKDDLENSIRTIIGAANLDLEQFNTNAPVGTVLAIMEQASRHQSAIVRGFHKSFGEELTMIYNLFGKILPDQPYPFKVPGKNGSIMKADFSDDIRIIPVSDPTVNSSALRMIRNQAIADMASAAPEQFDMYEINKLRLQELKVGNIDKLMPPPEKPDEAEATPVDPVSENINMRNGIPVKAGMTQNHPAHITVHGNDMQLQLQQNPEADMSVYKAHIHEHEVMEYQIQMEAMMSKKLPKDPNKLSMDEQNKLAVAAAQAIMAQQQQQQAGNPPPMDPTQVMQNQVDVDRQRVQVEAQASERKAEEANRKADLQQLESDRKFELAMGKAELDQLKLKIDIMKNEQQHQLDQLKLHIESQFKDQELKQEALKDVSELENKLVEQEIPEEFPTEGIESEGL